VPIKLVPPRDGMSKNWRIRGTYLRERVDQTTGTPDRKLAAKMLAKVREEIERGTFSRPGAPTFADAALSYCQAGGERRFVMRLHDHFGETPLTRIDQAAVDAAALALYPRATPATRNRRVYSPVSAILKAAGVAEGLKRPKGARGARRLFWLTPEQASALLTAAQARDAEFGLFLAFLLYTGCRLTEALSLQVAGVNLTEGWARVLETKNGEPRLVHLPPVIVAALATHPRGMARVGKLFRFGKNGRLYTWLGEAARAAGVEIPQGVAFHAFRHTWGAWLRRYAGLHTTGLVATGMAIEASRRRL
jgi:integrase